MPRKRPRVKSADGKPSAVESPETASTSSDQPDISDDAKLHKELNWCIEQLRLGLMTQKSSSKQVQESIRLIKVLSSSSAPLVKKRQIMRQTFGDYRKKIAEEEKRWQKETERLQKKAFIATAEQPREKSTYFRGSSHKKEVSPPSPGCCCDCQCQREEETHPDEPLDHHSEEQTAGGDETDEPPKPQFRFNFSILVV